MNGFLAEFIPSAIWKVYQSNSLPQCHNSCSHKKFTAHTVGLENLSQQYLGHSIKLNQLG